MLGNILVVNMGVTRMVGDGVKIFMVRNLFSLYKSDNL